MRACKPDVGLGYPTLGFPVYTYFCIYLHIVFSGSGLFIVTLPYQRILIFISVYILLYKTSFFLEMNWVLSNTIDFWTFCIQYYLLCYHTSLNPELCVYSTMYTTSIMCIIIYILTIYFSVYSCVYFCMYILLPLGCIWVTLGLRVTWPHHVTCIHVYVRWRFATVTWVWWRTGVLEMSLWYNKL